MPSIAWVPLFILWLGIFEASKVTLIAAAVTRTELHHLLDLWADHWPKVVLAPHDIRDRLSSPAASS